MSYPMNEIDGKDAAKIKSELLEGAEPKPTPLKKRVAHLLLNPEPLGRYWVVWSHAWNAWWGPDSNGYTTDLISAGLYTEEKAKEIASRDNYRGHCSIDGKLKPEVARKLADVIDSIVCGEGYGS